MCFLPAGGGYTQRSALKELICKEKEIAGCSYKLRIFCLSQLRDSIVRGVNKLLKTLAKLVSSSVISLAKSENNWAKNRETVSERETNLARLASGFVFLLANSELYSHLSSL
jgi:hypothetical protein